MIAPSAIRVLMVDDDEEDFIILRDLLRDATHGQYSIHWRSNYREGLEALRREDHDIALLDLQLGVSSGLDLVREARSLGVRGPIILLTGHGSYQVDLDAMEAGVSDYLVKGHIDTERLSRSIRYAIERSTQLEALERSEQRYRLLFESSPAALMVCDPLSLQVLATNPVSCELFGSNAERLLEQRLTDLLHPDELTRLLVSLDDYSSALTGTGSWRFRHAAGRELYLEMSSRALEFAGRPGMILLLQDVTQTMQAQRALREKDQEFRKLIENAADALVVTNPLGQILAVNHRAERLLGDDAARLSGRSLPIEPAPDQSQTTVVLRGDGERRLVELHSAPTRWNDDPAQIITLRDVTEQRRVSAELEYARNHDPVTGLSRFERVEQVLERQIQQDSQGPLAVLFINLDRFYSVNEAFGHAVGDRILHEMATRLALLVGGRGQLARVAGDEFLVVLPRVGTTLALRFAAEVANSVSKPVESEGFRTVVTASVGVAMFPDHGVTVPALVRSSEAAMTQAKRQGRDGVAMFAPEQAKEVEDRRRLGGLLRGAIQAGEMELHYQPQIDAQSRRVIGFEGLVRWNSPQFGLLSPGRFIPIVESMGLMTELGGHLIFQACGQIRQWLDRGRAPITISVNVAAQQLSRPGLVETVSDALERFRIPRGALELEFTESTIMDNVVRVNSTIESLKQLGVKLALDDFGTGYSSLSYLKQFALDKLKIDQSFVRDLPDDANDAAIARTIIAMGHQLKMRVSAEGIETERQSDFLIALGCDELQGFLFGPGEPAAQASRWLAAA